MATHKAGIPFWGWVVWLTVALLEVVGYRYLPLHIISHFSLRGRPNGFMRKPTFLIVSIGSPFVLIVVWELIWHWQVSASNAALIFRTMGGILVAFLSATNLWVAGHSLNSSLVNTRVPACLLGLLIVVCAPLLARVPTNSWVGIRTPRTLQDPRAWHVANRRSAQWGAIAGGVLAVMAWIVPIAADNIMGLGMVVIWLLLSIMPIKGRNKS